jgi:predicted transcriptional regulator
MSTELEQTESIFDKAKKVEQVGLLHLKGYSNSDIGDLESISQPTVRDYISQYKSYLEDRAEDDPYFLEKVQFNTIKALAEFDEISKESWETVEIATREGMVSARNQALKLCLDIATKKAQLHQLMGGTKTDGEYIARMQKAETVNQMISKVIRDVIADCEECRTKARPMLREAFSMMDDDEFITPEQASDSLDFEEGDVIEVAE